ncbi:putative methyltransferase-domain-containing protein [Fomitopsis serialis]|uniref:putative methyltransferase-domain-containing protein n=1 Tax=Fomitopsis serialis TaxID=139415 RepID=UPI002007E7E3|nr:putative methyltransferase-domain-containing protein [Neoantrodia serialis]KAH9931814.1 putative methyltransferase-domain-containing protein [Neoantrodia serialis]
MFFYLSFLRPPPSHVLPSSPVSITPQVANDLRTELLVDAQDIYYAWCLPSAPHAKPSQLPGITQPLKLTTWRQGSAYKELLVPAPPGIRESQYYCLVLTTHAQGHPHIINLGSADVGQRPFPVMSMPIFFSSKIPKTKLPSFSEKQVFMRVREQTSFDLDKKVWDSGVGLSSWITALANDDSVVSTSHAVARMKNALLCPERRHIIELGAGTGMVSLALGALRSTKATDGGCIITTDLSSAMPLLEHNISSNASLFSSDASRPRALTLDWDEQTLPPEVSATQDGFDVILMADVTYNTSAFPSLIRTVSDILRLRSAVPPSKSGSLETMILLGYKERDPAERTLWETMREIGVQLEKVDERRGAGGDPVEIWIGTVDRAA